MSISWTDSRRPEEADSAGNLWLLSYLSALNNMYSYSTVKFDLPMSYPECMNVVMFVLPFLNVLTYYTDRKPTFTWDTIHIVMRSSALNLQHGTFKARTKELEREHSSWPLNRIIHQLCEVSFSSQNTMSITLQKLFVQGNRLTGTPHFKCALFSSLLKPTLGNSCTIPQIKDYIKYSLEGLEIYKYA